MNNPSQAVRMSEWEHVKHLTRIFLRTHIGTVNMSHSLSPPTFSMCGVTGWTANKVGGLSVGFQIGLLDYTRCCSRWYLEFITVPYSSKYLASRLQDWLSKNDLLITQDCTDLLTWLWHFLVAMLVASLWVCLFKDINYSSWSHKYLFNRGSRFPASVHTL